MTRGRGGAPASAPWPGLLLALPFLGLLAPVPAPEDEGHTVVARLCAGKGLEPAELHELRAALFSLGPEALPSVYAALAGRAGAVPGRTARKALVDAVSSWPPRPTVEGLREALGPEPTLQERIVAIELLGTTASADAAEALVATLAETEAAFLTHPRLVAVARAAFENMLAHDPAAWRALERAAHGRVPRVLTPLVEAVGARGDPRGLPLLEELLELDPVLDRAVLEALGKMAPWGPGADPRRCAALVGFSLGAADPRIRRQAALALGRLRADDFAPELVRMLEDPDGRVARGALSALQELSGLSWSADLERWEGWLESEEAWAVERLPFLAGVLRGADSAAAVEAVREMSEHRLERRDVAEELVPALEHDDAAVAVAACSALLRLDEVRSLPALIDCLADRHARVRQAAHRTLHALTGAELPAIQRAWQAWLLGD